VDARAGQLAQPAQAWLQAKGMTSHANGGDSRPLAPIADFREIIDFMNENMRASTASCLKHPGPLASNLEAFSIRPHAFSARCGVKMPPLPL
jgi:hypothetical protein